MFKEGDKVKFVGNFKNHLNSKSKYTNLTLKELCEKYNNIFTIHSAHPDNDGVGSYYVEEDLSWCFFEKEFEPYLEIDYLNTLMYSLTSQMQNKNAENLLQPSVTCPKDICFKENVHYEPFDWLPYIKKMTNDIKGEKNMLEILNLYKKAKKENIGKKYQKEEDILIENDPLQIMVKETEEQANCLMGKKENEKISFNDKELLVTIETKEKIEELKDKCKKEHKELDDKIDQINALCDIANNYEEKISILKTSKILDKNLNFIL